MFDRALNTKNWYRADRERPKRFSVSSILYFALDGNKTPD